MTAPRHSRRGIIIPFALFGLVLAIWTGWWFYLANQVETRLTERVETLRTDGWQIDYRGAGVSGWPFRTRLELDAPSVIAPSGHGLSGSAWVAEANSWNPGKWVVIAPDGVTLTRPGKGQIDIAGRALRLSVSGLTDRFPDLRIQLITPTFAARPGAEAFPISAAERIELYTRPNVGTDGTAATDRMDVLFRLIEARGRAGGPVDGAAQRGTLTAEIETTLDKADRLSGADTGGILANWAQAGGRFTDIRGQIAAGDSRARLSSPALTVQADGRLQGEVEFSAVKATGALAGIAGSDTSGVNPVGAAAAAAVAGPADAVAGDTPRPLTIVFRDGRTWLGPFPFAPAPKLF